jgi:hypothetical protein
VIATVRFIQLQAASFQFSSANAKEYYAPSSPASILDLLAIFATNLAPQAHWSLAPRFSVR